MDEDDLDKAGQYTLSVMGFLFDATNDIPNEFLAEWNLERPEGEQFDINLEYFEDLIDFKFSDYCATA